MSICVTFISFFFYKKGKKKKNKKKAEKKDTWLVSKISDPLNKYL